MSEKMGVGVVDGVTVRRIFYHADLLHGLGFGVRYGAAPFSFYLPIA